MKVDLKLVAGAIQEAIDAARQSPDEEPADIVNAIIGRIGVVAAEDEGQADPAVKKAAHDRLHTAASQLAEAGDTPQTPLVNAIIGVGLALLANGEDAESFYAIFSEGQAHA